MSLVELMGVMRQRVGVERSDWAVVLSILGIVEGNKGWLGKQKKIIR